MLKNYFKIAMAVLRRRKFFTFISLFGISFTLTVVTVLASFLDHLISAGYPDTNRDRELFVNTVRLQSDKGYRMTGGASFYMLDHYVSKLKTPSKISIASVFVPTNAYVNNRKLVINLKYTNAQYWEVLQYTFTEGRPYLKQQVDEAERVAVISEDTKKAYFGTDGPVIGKYIEADNVQYRVIGVVKNVAVTKLFYYADIYVPYTLSKTNLQTKDLVGEFTGILLANSPSDLGRMREEYNAMVRKIPVNDKEFEHLISFADTYLESFTRASPFSGNTDSGMTMVLIVSFVIFLLFLLLPTLNLVNINISRILERSSEIGVRKAFGASSKTLVYQFIVENIILTLIGGVVGLLLSLGTIMIINGVNLVDNMRLELNFTVLGSSLAACLFFGFLSGVYPAWRMSRVHVVTALKAQ